MYVLGKIKVTSVIPDRLSRLNDLACNLWWSWNPEAIDLYREIDLPLWEKLGKNPVRFLGEVSNKRLLDKINDPDFMKRYEDVINNFDQYMSNKEATWFNLTYPEKKDHMVAYFSAEYGLHEILPIYSGGLGVLSGDHCKSASDLGIPFTAIGLFYKQGYFIQRINREGWQETNYPDLNVNHLPIKPVLLENGEQLEINVHLMDRIVFAKIWQVKVGRINLYLMDTDVEKNSPSDRWITARLYGGDQDTRIQQEILLGIGGLRVLDALGINATVYHMNEGHSAFLGLELMKKLINEKKLPYREAKEYVASALEFTTHTPVPAGNDVFPIDMIDRYFNNYWLDLGISRNQFHDLGFKTGEHHYFNMAVLALTLSGKRNGVSELHGAVSRNIFNNVWPGIQEEDIPIGHITNGIHTMTWMSPNFKRLYNNYMGKEWEQKLYQKDVWDKVVDIPDQEIWKTHVALKIKMIAFLRDKLKTQKRSNGESPESIRDVDAILDPNTLTIGFARRFATYKRADLIFRNMARIQKILNNPQMPVQIVFAGKAHPADRPAHEIIKHINDIAGQEGFKGKVLLLENYNMTVARNLVQGVDVWMNNPRRPLEASGTSGQKVCINGVINFSVLDGWWCEGYNGNNGWAIGDDTFYDNEFHQDNADSESIYDTLEKEIIPLYYDRDSSGIPTRWVSMMKESIRSLAFQYSTHRMLQDYTSKMYVPSMERVDKINESKFTFLHNLADWKLSIENNWSQVQILAERSAVQTAEHSIRSGEAFRVSTTVNLGHIEPESVKVELCYGILNNNAIDNPEVVEMKLEKKVAASIYSYEGEVTLQDGGEYGYAFRVVPFHPDLINKFEMGLIR